MEITGLKRQYFLKMLGSVEDATDRWMFNPDVEQGIKKLGISHDAFKNRFGRLIVNHFFSGLIGTGTPGSCPVMMKLVDHLLSRRVALREVYTLCNGLRRELVERVIRVREPSLRQSFLLRIEEIHRLNFLSLLERFESAMNDDRHHRQEMSDSVKRYRLSHEMLEASHVAAAVIGEENVLAANARFKALFGLEDDLEQLHPAIIFSSITDCSHQYEDLRDDDVPGWLQSMAQEDKSCLLECVDGLSGKKRRMACAVSRFTPGTGTYLLSMIDVDGLVDNARQAMLDVDARQKEAVERVNAYLASSLAKDENGGMAPDDFEQALSAIHKASRGKEGAYPLVMLKLSGPVGEETRTSCMKMLTSSLPEDAHISRLENNLFAILLNKVKRAQLYEFASGAIGELAGKGVKANGVIVVADHQKHPKQVVALAYELMDEVESDADYSLLTNCERIMAIQIAQQESERLTSLLSRSKALETMIQYKGLPVGETNRVYRLIDRGVELDASPGYCARISSGDEVFMRFHTGEYARGYCARKELKKNRIFVQDIMPMESSPMQRQYVRVDVAGNITAKLTDIDGRVQEGEVVAISNISVSIRVPRLKHFVNGVGAELSMELPFEAGEKELNAFGFIWKAKRDRDDYTLAIGFSGNQTAGELLEAYVQSRVEAIRLEMEPVLPESNQSRSVTHRR